MTAEEIEIVEDQDAQKDKYLTFQISSEEYAIAITYVTEIIGMLNITEVPQTPSYIKGVINLRGKVIPVMDVRLRFNMAARDYDERTCVVVVNLYESTVGLVVDTVSEVLDIPSENIDSSIILDTFSTIESSTIVLITETLLNSAVFEIVPLPDLIFCLFPEPLPLPSVIVNPLTTSFNSSIKIFTLLL